MMFLHPQSYGYFYYTFLFVFCSLFTSNSQYETHKMMSSFSFVLLFVLLYSLLTHMSAGLFMPLAIHNKCCWWFLVGWHKNYKMSVESSDEKWLKANGNPTQNSSSALFH